MSMMDDSSTGSDFPEDVTEVLGGNEDQVPTGAEALAKRENTAVFRLRVVVFLALFLAAGAVSLVIWFNTSLTEERDFETHYDAASAKLMESFEQVTAQKMGILASFTLTLTSYARSHNNTWPFVTMNDFQQRAATARNVSGSLFMEVLPIIEDDTREAWEVYSVANKGWLDEGRKFQQDLGIERIWSVDPADQVDDSAASSAADVKDQGVRRRNLDELQNNSYVGENVVHFVAEAGADAESSYIADSIWRFDETFTPIRDPGPGPYYPIWTSSPILASPRDLVNWNLMDYPGYAPFVKACAETGQIVIGRMDVHEPGDISSENLPTSFFAFILSYAARKNTAYIGDPISSFYVPIFDSFDAAQKKQVGVLVAVMRSGTYFEGVLGSNSRTLTVVLENSCQGAFTYHVCAKGVRYIGEGDLHDPKYNEFARTKELSNKLKIHEDELFDFRINENQCLYSLKTYPTQEFEEQYQTGRMPLVTTLSVGLVFVFTALMFLVYDRIVERRQRLVLGQALQSTAVVSSLFPSQVRDRVLANMQQSNGAVTGTKTQLKSFLTSGGGTHSNAAELAGVEAADSLNDPDTNYMYKTKPIADLFPDVTIMFADIAGFTSWSSSREPSQVFTLLETLYKAFDEIAQRRRVFKVETVGDCYVAVAGLPDPRKDHALVMARFATDCLSRMNVLCKKLDLVLGPDTSDLRLRVGLHSGPVTAGVLRGERSRFQLFGDSMNTASRMESTGDPNRIQLSQETADLLYSAGKASWITPRDDAVYAKGKGQLNTYYLNIPSSTGSTSITDGSGGASDKGDDEEEVEKEAAANREAVHGIGNAAELASTRTKRLIEWNVDVLKRLLREVVARRRAQMQAMKSQPPESFRPKPHHAKLNGQTVIDEVVEIVHLPQFDAKIAAMQESLETIKLNESVCDELRTYVASIIALYNDNPFHNFEHATHVTMSIVKLLSRIVAPSDFDFKDARHAKTSLHDHTYGITSDPLTQLACVLSGLIHDADHRGVPNSQLVKEKNPIAAAYKNKSVAEQNSVDLCLDLLMEDDFGNLRACIFPTEAEYYRFRQLVVNSVMATDIMDKDLKQLRNSRWEKAFSETAHEESINISTNRKATIVIEHLIQASDVAHTMQHWHIYRKWNERLFEEMYKAFITGRAETDPTESWYKGEIGFFDFYIIPLAKKLKDCGVFGVSSDEYLNYAQKNRLEWASRGQQVVEEMSERIKKQYGERKA